MLPGGEIFQALEKGAIDATEFSLPNVDESLGFDRIAKLNYYPGWHQTYTSAHLVVNSEEWLALNAAQKRLFNTACTAASRGISLGRKLSRDPSSRGFPLRVLKRYGCRYRYYVNSIASPAK